MDVAKSSTTIQRRDNRQPPDFHANIKPPSLNCSPQYEVPRVALRIAESGMNTIIRSNIRTYSRLPHDHHATACIKAHAWPHKTITYLKIYWPEFSADWITQIIESLTFYPLMAEIAIIRPDHNEIPRS
jgi:hypothetical protein